MHARTVASHARAPSMRHHEMAHWDGHIGRQSSQQRKCKYCSYLSFTKVGWCASAGGGGGGGRDAASQVVGRGITRVKG